MKRFIPAIAASIALVLAAPFIGQLRSSLLAAFPDHYRLIIGGTVVGLVAIAVVAAITRIHDRKALRYGCIAAALSLGSGYAWLTATGDPSVDVVERFHFVEYGLIAFLFYRAWRPFDSHALAQGKPGGPIAKTAKKGTVPFMADSAYDARRSAGDASLFVLPLLAGILVGTCEEWLQWFVPARIGEVRDVFLNLWALGCGLLFSVGVDPPERLAFSLRRESWMRVRRFGAVVLLVFALFFHSVHLGYEINDSETGVFRSAYDADTLLTLSRERAARWRHQPPLTWSRLSREDQYFSEGVAHAQARNRCWGQGNIRCARRENLILERYFAPVLDTPSFVSATGLRWHPDQRADAELREKDDAGEVERDESIIYTWPKPVFWVVVLAATGGLLLL